MFEVLKESLKPPTQQEQAEGTVKNNAGGYTFQTTNWQQLDRFLCMGITGGTYYVGEKELLKQNLEPVKACIAEDAQRVLDRVVEISTQGRALNNDAAIYAMALLCSQKGPGQRPGKNGTFSDVVCSTPVALKAMELTPKTVRTFTGMAKFMTFIKRGRMRGFGRSFQRTLSNAWFKNRSVEDIVFSLIKYGSRYTFSQQDVYRILKPMNWTNHPDEARKGLYDYLFYFGEQRKAPTHPRLIAAEQISKVETSAEAVKLMQEHKLPFESVPTNLLDQSVYEMGIKNNHYEWLLRNLGNMSKQGLTKPFASGTNLILDKLLDKEALQKSKLHPMNVAKAMLQYQKGKGHKGGNTWEVNQAILSGLNEAFYNSFGNVVPTGKKILVAIDVSGSMCASNAIIPEMADMPVLTAAAIVAMAITKTEKNFHIIGFDAIQRGLNGQLTSGIHDLGIHHTQRLDNIVDKLSSIRGGATDCGLPFKWAIENREVVDLFIVLTDSETWAGKTHVHEMLAEYRRRFNAKAKAINIAMVANRATILPENPLNLEVIGFDAQVPKLINEFLNE